MLRWFALPKSPFPFPCESSQRHPPTRCEALGGPEARVRSGSPLSPTPQRGSDPLLLGKGRHLRARLEVIGGFAARTERQSLCFEIAVLDCQREHAAID